LGATGRLIGFSWPRFDSSACFAALLGGSRNGRWIIEPIAGVGYHGGNAKGVGKQKKKPG
jgi:hypothetical protein